VITSHRASRKPWCQPGLFELALLALACGACGFGRGDGPFCKNSCKDPEQRRDFFCNCYTPDKRDPSPDETGLVFLDRKGECIPATVSPQVWLVNGTNRRQVVRWKEEYWEGGQKIWEKEDSVTLGPGQRKYLGCEGTLYYDHQYTILSSNQAAITQPAFPLERWPGSPDHVAGMISRSPQVTLVAFQAEVPSNSSCRALCPDLSTTARCTTTSLPSENQSGLRVLYSKVVTIADGNSLIEADDLRSWFSVEEDPCERGPTAFFGGKLLNVGGPCLLEARLGPSSLVQVSVPMVVAGEVHLTASALDATLQGTPMSRPQIHFLKAEDGSPDFLDADFGGEILAIEADGSAVYFRVETNRCIGVRY
jgi:hypothetical protein